MLQMTQYSKNEIAKWMLYRGQSFLKSAILLKQSGGSHDVELYNICQGIEVVLKSFLLFKDYDKYKPLLPNRARFGHNLVKLTDAAIFEYGIKSLSSDETTELELLNEYYINHYLRYSGAHDLLFPSTNVKYGRIVRKLMAYIKLAIRNSSNNEIQ